jgi:ubiquinone/menaquinone biosynthesis C-methylase UbiE
VDILIRERRWKERYFKLKFREMIKPYLIDSKKHLDFGCGFGYFAYLLSRDYPRMKIVGIDTNKQAIKEGRKRYKRKNLRLIATSEIRGKYTSISCCLVLHELPNLKKYVKEFYKHLEKNGNILVYDFRKASREKFADLYKKRKYKEESFEEFYKKHCKWSPRQLADMFKKVGFKTLKTKSIGDYWCLYVGKKMS